jgi:putative transposase
LRKRFATVSAYRAQGLGDRLRFGLPKLDYPLHDRIVTVTSCGRLCIGRRKINLSRAFAGQDVGIREVAEKIWLVTFMHYDLGFFDHETGRVECAPNPFETQVLPMSPV